MRLRQLSALTLTLKPIIDEFSEYPDLGLELHEYALLKSGGSRAAESFDASIKKMLGDSKQP